MSEQEERKPRRRPRPTFAIHGAAGVRIAGGSEDDWWDTSRPDVDPVAARAIYSTDCREESAA